MAFKELALAGKPGVTTLVLRANACLLFDTGHIIAVDAIDRKIIRLQMLHPGFTAATGRAFIDGQRKRGIGGSVINSVSRQRYPGKKEQY